MPTLARRRLGTGSLMVFGIVASSPLTVLVGGIPATYAGTGVAGLPLAFVLVTAVLALLSVAYLRVTRYLTHTAPFFALLARGLSGRAGVAGAVVMFVGYNVIQISLYGFIGTRMAGLVGGAWWSWAIAAWLVIAVFGVMRMSTNAILLGGLLLVELSVIALFVVAAFTHATPAPSPFTWGAIEGPALSGVLALTMAAFLGFECGPVYGEEARSPRTVTVATYAVLVFLGMAYALLAWAVYAGIGLATLTAGGDPTALVFELLRRTYGAGPVALATMLLVTSVLAAMASFHHVVARQVFGLARERILPSALTTLSQGTGGGTPVAGSLVQTGLAGVVLAVFIYMRADPMAMFVWLSTVGALFVLSLMVAASAAAYGFYRAGGGGNESLWLRAIAPIGGALVGGLVVAGMVSNLRSLLALPPGSRLAWLPLMVLAACVAGGWVWGSLLRRLRPQTYRQLGLAAPNPVATRDPRLDEVEV